jgi:iron(III) transport system permease protein
MGNAVPGLVVGLALVFFAANALPALYQTLPILIAACAIRFLPFGVASTRTALGQIEPALEEAARGLGLSPMRVLLRVTAPLARAGIFAGMALVFLNVMKELPTVLLLAPIGFRTLATRIWSASESGTIALVGLPGLALVLVSALSLALLLWRDHHTAAHRS